MAPLNRCSVAPYSDTVYNLKKNNKIQLSKHLASKLSVHVDIA